MNDKPTRKEQMEHQEKIRRLARRLNDCDRNNYFMPHLTREDFDTIIRALMLHDSVITLDMAKQDGKDINVPGKDVPDTNVGKWIPVSKRLPDKAGEYMVTYHPCYWDIVEDRLDVGVNTFRGKTTWAKKKHQKVVAWCEKPEPYQEAGNE